jgi:sulfoxide reductase heme-binding subunit YedZ
VSPRPLDHFWWLASRSSGIVALALMTASVLVGLLLAAKVLKRPGMSKALAVGHQYLAVGSLLAIGLHGVTLLGDPWLRPGLVGIAVPFTISYEPFFTGLGIAGGYLAAALGLSYWARKRFGSSRWRNAHRWVIIAWAMSVVHTLGAGTDAGSPAMVYGVVGSVAVAIALGGIRVGAGLSKRRGTAPRRPAPRPQAVTGATSLPSRTDLV